jgi:hypothetical protein
MFGRSGGQLKPLARQAVLVEPESEDLVRRSAGCPRSSPSSGPRAFGVQPVKLRVEAAMGTYANAGTRLEGDANRRIYDSEVLLLLQVLLTMVADLDCDYERERDQIGATLMDPDLRDTALEELETRHHERRDPYLQRLRRIGEQLPLGVPSR